MTDAWTPVLSKNAPQPNAHASQAIIANGMVYCSGSLGIHPQTKMIVGGAYDQTKQALNNLKAILEEAGTRETYIVKATIFLSSMDHYAEVNRAYNEFFGDNPRPGRTCVAVFQLPLAGADVEIEATASFPPTSARF